MFKISALVRKNVNLPQDNDILIYHHRIIYISFTYVFHEKLMIIIKSFQAIYHVHKLNMSSSWKDFIIISILGCYRWVNRIFYKFTEKKKH